MAMLSNTGRRQAQRMYPVAEDDPCDHCGGVKTLQRHHIDNDPSNNSRDNIAFLCAMCHGAQHRTVPSATCEICAATFLQPARLTTEGASDMQQRGLLEREGPPISRVAVGVMSRVDRLRAIGNGQVPAVAARAWEILSA